jgi:PilZ domain-containing protein
MPRRHNNYRGAADPLARLTNMSKIYEALRSAEATRKTDVQVAEPEENSKKARNRRRSARREYDAVVRVYGHAQDGNTFYQQVRTINVSTHGALLELKIPVVVGQKLLLINEETRRQQICQIVNTRVHETNTLHVAVEFPVPHAEFWEVFSSRRKARSSEEQRPASGVAQSNLVPQTS